MLASYNEFGSVPSFSCFLEQFEKEWYNSLNVRQNFPVKLAGPELLFVGSPPVLNSSLRSNIGEGDSVQNKKGAACYAPVWNRPHPSRGMTTASLSDCLDPWPSTFSLASTFSLETALRLYSALKQGSRLNLSQLTRLTGPAELATSRVWFPRITWQQIDTHIVCNFSSLIMHSNF